METDDSKAIEAAARAIAFRNYPSVTAEDLADMTDCWRADAQAAITAYLSAEREAGRVMVPVEATNGMLGDGWGETPCEWRGTWDDLQKVWAKMIAARPNGEG